MLKKPHCTCIPCNSAYIHRREVLLREKMPASSLMMTLLADKFPFSVTFIAVLTSHDPQGFLTAQDRSHGWNGQPSKVGAGSEIALTGHLAQKVALCQEGKLLCLCGRVH